MLRTQALTMTKDNAILAPKTRFLVSTAAQHYKYLASLTAGNYWAYWARSDTGHVTTNTGPLHTCFRNAGVW